MDTVLVYAVMLIARMAGALQDPLMWVLLPTMAWLSFRYRSVVPCLLAALAAGYLNAAWNWSLWEHFRLDKTRHVIQVFEVKFAYAMLVYAVVRLTMMALRVRKSPASAS